MIERQIIDGREATVAEIDEQFVDLVFDDNGERVIARRLAPDEYELEAELADTEAIMRPRSRRRSAGEIQERALHARRNGAG